MIAQPEVMLRAYHLAAVIAVYTILGRAITHTVPILIGVVLPDLYSNDTLVLLAGGTYHSALRVSPVTVQTDNEVIGGIHARDSHRVTHTYMKPHTKANRKPTSTRA